jgi:SH3-like domain-containing protein
VLLATERLRTAPAVGAETGVGFVAGETAQLVATRGIWERIRFNDNRDGWVERRVLESLDLPPAR